MKIDLLIRDLKLKRDRASDNGFFISQQLQYNKKSKRLISERDKSIVRMQELNNKLNFYRNLREAITKNDIRNQKTR